MPPTIQANIVPVTSQSHSTSDTTKAAHVPETIQAMTRSNHNAYQPRVGHPPELIITNKCACPQRSGDY